MTNRRALLVSALTAGAVPLAELVRPKDRLSDRLPPLVLERDLPKSFHDWRIDSTVVPLLPDPTLQKTLDLIYTQTLARTYINSVGQRVMVSVAYGSDQGSDATSVHRPEFCYGAQGFAVSDAGVAKLPLINGRFIEVQQLIAVAGPRFEPIIYWVTLANKAVLPGIDRKIEQLRYGLVGTIPDGMLVRTSTLGLRSRQSFDLQAEFLAQLYAALAGDIRKRVFGI